MDRLRFSAGRKHGSILPQCDYAGATTQAQNIAYGPFRFPANETRQKRECISGSGKMKKIVVTHSRFGTGRFVMEAAST